jgi:hypothetical protein
MHSWRGTRRSRVLSAVFAIAALVALALAVGFSKATPSAQGGYQNTGPTTVKITQNAQFISSFQINVVLTISCTGGSGYFASVDVQQPQGFGFTSHGNGQTSGQCTGRQQKVVVSVFTFDGSWQIGNAVASATVCTAACGSDTKQIHIVA